MSASTDAILMFLSDDTLCADRFVRNPIQVREHEPSFCFIAVVRPLSAEVERCFHGRVAMERDNEYLLQFAL